MWSVSICPLIYNWSQRVQQSICNRWSYAGRQPKIVQCVQGMIYRYRQRFAAVDEVQEKGSVAIFIPKQYNRA